MSERTAVLDDSLRAEIKAMVCEILRAEPGTVTPTSRFIEDHGADSLQFLDVLASIEQTCGVMIDPEEMGSMTTLAGIYAVVERAL